MLDLSEPGWADIFKGLERWTPEGHPARRGDQPAAGQHLPRPARCGMAERGAAWCGMRTTSSSYAGATKKRPPPSRRFATGWRKRPHAASRKDASRRLPPAGPRLRVPGLQVRSRPATGAQEEPGHLQGKIREKTRRTRGDSLVRVADLNPTLRGWFGYFKHAHHSSFGSWTGSSEDGCAPSCASRRNAPRAMPSRPSTLAQPLLRTGRAVRPSSACLEARAPR